jgi:hypothetical protein
VSWNKRISFDEGLARIRKLAEKPARQDRPDMVRREDIRMAVSVFQPRQLQEDLGEDEAHVRELARALNAKPKGSRYLDPVLVIAVGKAFYCLDGMHRLLAYKRAGVDGPVPVEHFEGSMEDAIKEAVTRNSRDRLAMTSDDKLEAAWRLTVLGVHSKREVAEATGASERTIATMRTTLRKLQEGDKDPGGFGSAVRIPATWREARRLLSGDDFREFTDEMREAQVREWARRLAKTFGNKPGKQAEVFADALETAWPRLPQELVRAWEDLTLEIAREIGNDPDMWDDPPKDASDAKADDVAVGGF